MTPDAPDGISMSTSSSRDVNNDRPRCIDARAKEIVRRTFWIVMSNGSFRAREVKCRDCCPATKSHQRQIADGNGVRDPKRY